MDQNDWTRPASTEHDEISGLYGDFDPYLWVTIQHQKLTSSLTLLGADRFHVADVFIISKSNFLGLSLGPWEVTINQIQVAIADK